MFIEKKRENKVNEMYLGCTTSNFYENEKQIHPLKVCPYLTGYINKNVTRRGESIRRES